jgi:hypothetical protein
MRILEAYGDPFVDDFEVKLVAAAGVSPRKHEAIQRLFSGCRAAQSGLIQDNTYHHTCMRGVKYDGKIYQINFGLS